MARGLVGPQHSPRGAREICLGPLRSPTGASPLATGEPVDSELLRPAWPPMPCATPSRVSECPADPAVAAVVRLPCSRPCEMLAGILAKSGSSLERRFEKKILPTAQGKIDVFHLPSNYAPFTPANTTPAHPASAARQSRSVRDSSPARCNCTPGPPATPKSNVGRGTPPTPDTARTRG